MTVDEIQTVLGDLPFQYTFRATRERDRITLVAGTARLGDARTNFAVISGATEDQLAPSDALPGAISRADIRGGTGYRLLFWETRTSVPAISERIDAAMCRAVNTSAEACLT